MNDGFNLAIFSLLATIGDNFLRAYQCGISLFEPVNFEQNEIIIQEFATTNEGFKIPISNGKNVTDIRWLPWMVSLFDGHCAASVIGPKYILTAGHCVWNLDKTLTYSLYYGNNVFGQEQVENSFQGSKIRLHPNFKRNLCWAQSDLAIIEIEFDNSVSPICLRRSCGESDQETVLIAGWGLEYPLCKLQQKIIYDGILKYGQAMVVGEAECRTIFMESIKYYSQCGNNQTAWEWVWAKNKVDKICIRANPSGSESGDSGGPLMKKTDRNRWVQLGVCSVGFCNPQLEDPNTRRITMYTKFEDQDCNWIYQVTNGTVKCQ